MPLRGLFIGICYSQYSLLRQGFGHYLHAYGKAVHKSCRKGYGRDASYVDGNGADIVQVHLERVFYLGTQLERHRGRGGRDQDIVLLEGLMKLSAYEGTHLLGLEVVGVVVARRQGVGAHQNTAFNFVAKAFAARALVQVRQIFRIVAAVAVAHAA